MQLMFDIGWALSRFIGSVVIGAKVAGREHLPKEGAFILAPNHLSYFDPPLVGSYVPRRVHFFAKQELFEIPVFGAIVRRINVHPVKRGVFDRNALKTAVALLRAGNPLTVFPEGTRGDRDRFLPPKPGIGMIARQAEVPIIPCLVDGTERAWKCITRRERCLICYGAPISADWIKSLPESKKTWLKIAEEVMSRLARMRASLRDGEGGEKVAPQESKGSRNAEATAITQIERAGEDFSKRVDTQSMIGSAKCMQMWLQGVAEKGQDLSMPSACE